MAGQAENEIPQVSEGTPLAKEGRGGVWILRALVVVALAAYLGSGLYIIRPNEIGIVRLFGKVVSTVVDGKPTPEIVLPGLHFRLPYPITRLNRVRPAETKTLAIGFEPVDQILGRAADPRRSEFLTGDQNIMQLRMTVQYTVDDPVAWLFGATDPEAVVRADAESCLADAVASIGVDDLIGAERVKAAASVRQELDRQIAFHASGVRITAVSLQAPTPPKEAAAAFNDVQSAKAEKYRAVLEAEAYRNDIVTRASGEAEKSRREGEAYRERRVAEAEGEAKRFEDLYEQYRQARAVTWVRLYIEAMEEILPAMKKVFVDSEKGGSPIDLGLFNVKP
jgi:membrane protease subunit HflK